ncbi:MATE family efflux transporter [Escherichia coli]
MGVLSTFLVSWLGKDAMAGVGGGQLQYGHYGFFCSYRSWYYCRWALSLGKRNRRRARVATRQSLVIMTLFAVLLATLIHHFGEQIIDFVAGDATTDVKALALTYLSLPYSVIQQLPSLLLVTGRFVVQGIRKYRY